MTTRTGPVAAIFVTLLLASGRAADDNTWTIATDDIEATFRLSAAGLELESIVNPRTGSLLNNIPGPVGSVTINGTTSSVGSSAAGWALQSASQDSTDASEQLTLTFRSQRAPITATRTFVCYRGAPVVETWTTFRGTGTTAVTVSNFNVWQLTIPSEVVHYEHGLRSNAANQGDEAFTLQRVDLRGGGQLDLDERNRSTERYLPMVAADLEDDEFFGGLMWSGSWRILAQGVAERQLRLTAGFSRVTTTVDASRPLETPHGFFGFTPGDRADVSRALRPFIVAGIRGGRPFRPLVTANTWFTYGTEIDQQSMMDEMAGAATAGVERFVVDAGWYRGAGKGSDFDPGLGSWEVDRQRFPDGLGALREFAHSLGMQFGIWVEPERVALSTVGKPGLAQQSWIASEDGHSGSVTTGQLCLASPTARQWVIDRLIAFLDEVRPDYLKWDNNLWVSCNRSGHAHGAGDGNFAHVKGLYQVLSILRERYPDMQIENCSQGGNRLDFGMLRYTDTAWMDDRTSPAVHVRHNLEGLMTFFPPAYLLSFVLNDNEPMVDSPDLALFLRSRMPGILGLTYHSAALAESDRDRLAHEIGVYKDLREVIASASAALLTDQAARENGPAWDAVQMLREDSGEAVIFAFQNDRAVPAVAVWPRGLDPDVIYEVARHEGEPLRTGTGAELMDGGLDIEEWFESAAHVIRLRPVGRVDPDVSRSAGSPRRRK
jgi:alpha-galactosidase